ncbi:hypothetical protein ACFQZO_10540 [Bradyrhizobium sp. GCM10027634]|uniref:hypothetical protein n=1 Tax=unclassified Bradyrhizobium TaxID=2631580 RepID=UPI00188CB1BB|nr:MULTISPECIES: hypothetical protein [unclassified Bradyrhizobium]MDN5001321.1 hypothetical protein [Bradyrhizobium sp. WYCCWR 12677]QOZ46317.1 hypothetical protein XH89_24755 [Bradyrhizobium sp. CCBAU 53340]
MDKDGQAAQERATKQKEERLAPDRGKPAVEAGRLDRALKNALEDDEVREALNLHGQGRRPSL